MNASYRLARIAVAAHIMLLIASVAAWAQGDSTRKGTPVDLELDAQPIAAPTNSVGRSMHGTYKAAGSGAAMQYRAGTLGATIGGAQDIGYARKLIQSGKVPQFIDFSPEGLYSEHDIPTPSSECNDKLCLSLGYGYAPTADNSSNALFVHLGMTSNIKPEEFRRATLQLTVVIDKSGSMEGESMNAVKHALRQLVARLGPDDELMLVQFNDEAELLLPATRVSDRAAIGKAIDMLTADGGTDIESGLALGFKGLAALPAREGTAKRLMLFTDAMPNVGRTDSGSFRQLTERYAAQGIGFTAFGVGTDFGQQLIYHITQLRGCNFFYLESPEKIAKVFDTEFDYLVTPLVYDLDVRIATPEGLKLTAVYGLPTWKPGDRDAVLHIPTVFLSSNRGAIVLRYERDGDGPLALGVGDEIATGTLTFTGTDGAQHREQTVLRHSGAGRLEPGTQFYTHDGMRMAVALTNIYFGLRDGCRLLSEGKQKEAIEAIGRGRGIAMLENIALGDNGLADEIKLLEKLQENIEKGVAVRQPPGSVPN